MKTISLCIIVKDEQNVISRVLSCAKEFADEIVIVDTGSSDKTIEICSGFTDKIYSFEWIDDFSAARNFSFSKATMDYQMWLDADDFILPSDIEKIREWKSSPSRPAVVMLNYNTAFDSNGNPTFSYYRERLLRRDMGFVWNGAVHEVISPRGEVEYLDAAISHMKEKTSDPARNLNIYRKMLEKGIAFTPRDRFYYARELYYNGFFTEAIDELKIVFDCTSAWLENRIEACRVMYNCYIQLSMRKKALEVLFSSFLLTPPRAEICCDIGEWFMEEKDYTTAIFWYRLATTLPKNQTSGAFISNDCYDFIPYLQLCVCYDRLGDIPNARLYHQKSSLCKPYDSAVLHNTAYFSDK